MNKRNRLLVIIFLLMNVQTLQRSADEPVVVTTITQEKIRPSYPFPAFLSTGPYIWYKDAENKPTKGHTFRIATFSENRSYQIFIEKVQFGDKGCCLEIIDYRQLIINEETLKKAFPSNTGKHGFKLIRWIKPEAFEFQAYGGTYVLSNISSDSPLIQEQP